LHRLATALLGAGFALHHRVASKGEHESHSSFRFAS
jgi:hypothetical protein